MMPTADFERLCEYLTHKMSSNGVNDLQTIVCTTIADTLLVADGVLTVDDFAPTEVP